MLPSYTLANYWESIPEELRVLTIRHLFRQADYKKIIDIDKVPVVHLTIEADPTLKATFEGVKELEDPFANLMRSNELEDYSTIIKSIINIALAKSDNGQNLQVLNLLGSVIFKEFGSFVDRMGGGRTPYVLVTSNILTQVGEDIPVSYLPGFDKLLELISKVPK